MKDKFSNRLQEAMQIKNIKASELSEKANIPKSAISQYLSGLYEAKQKSIFKLANALDVSESWLMGLDVPMQKQTVKVEQTDELGNPVVQIPILGTVKAGYNYFAQENWLGTVEVDKKSAAGNDLFALIIKGDSMLPDFKEGDIAIIKKQNDFKNGDYVVAIIDGQEATIKKGKKGSSGILLQPLNTEYEPLIFTYKEVEEMPVEIIGVVKELKRKFF